MPDDTEQINIFACPLGECYIMSNLYPIIFKDNTKKTVNITTKDFTQEIFDMYCPIKVDFPYKFGYNETVLKYSHYEYKNKQINYFLSGTEFFYDFWYSEDHIVDALKKYLGIKGKIPFHPPQIPKKAVGSLNRKIKKMGLGDNFIFVSPEARSIYEI